jgi:hypothetical protein
MTGPVLGQIRTDARIGERQTAQPRIGLADTSAIVGFVAVVGAIITVSTLPSPRARAWKNSPKSPDGRQPAQWRWVWPKAVAPVRQRPS